MFAFPDLDQAEARTAAWLSSEMERELTKRLFRHKLTPNPGSIQAVKDAIVEAAREVLPAACSLRPEDVTVTTESPGVVNVTVDVKHPPVLRTVLTEPVTIGFDQAAENSGFAGVVLQRRDDGSFYVHDWVYRKPGESIFDEADDEADTTLDEVREAAIAACEVLGAPRVNRILWHCFGVERVSDLEAADYDDVVEVLEITIERQKAKDEREVTS